MLPSLVVPPPPAIGWSLMHRGPSVCPSVCHVPDPKSRTDEHSKLEIGRKEAHHRDDP